MDDCVEAAGPCPGRALPNRRTSSAAHPTGDENKAFFGTARGETRVRLRAGICDRWQGAADERDAGSSCRRPNAASGRKPPRPRGLGRRGGRLRCCARSTMSQHRHRSRANAEPPVEPRQAKNLPRARHEHPAPRRSQRSPRGFHHGLLWRRWLQCPRRSFLPGSAKGIRRSRCWTERISPCLSFRDRRPGIVGPDLHEHPAKVVS
jgi:hypothetical protein